MATQSRLKACSPLVLAIRYDLGFRDLVIASSMFFERPHA